MTPLEASEPTLEPCRWCVEGDTPKFLDRDGTLVSITGNEGVLSHAHEEYWWPCLKFGVEIRCARVSANGVPTVNQPALAEWLDMLVVALKASQKFDYNEWGQFIMGAESWADKLRAAASTVAPVEQSERSLMLEARRILMLLHDPSTHGPNYAAVENEIAAALRSIICAAYEDAAVIAENCSQDEAARDEPFRIAQTIREQVRRLFATRVVPAPSAAVQDEAESCTCICHNLIKHCARCIDQPCRAANAKEWPDVEGIIKLVAARVFPNSENSLAIKELAQGVAAHFGWPDRPPTTTPSSAQARAAARAIASALERDEVPRHVEESEPFITAIIERCLSEGEA